MCGWTGFAGTRHAGCARTAGLSSGQSLLQRGGRERTGRCLPAAIPVVAADPTIGATTAIPITAETKNLRMSTPFADWMGMGYGAAHGGGFPATHAGARMLGDGVEPVNSPPNDSSTWRITLICLIVSEPSDRTTFAR